MASPAPAVSEIDGASALAPPKQPDAAVVMSTSDEPAAPSKEPASPLAMQQLLEQLNRALLDSATLPPATSAQLIEICALPIANMVQQREQVTDKTIQAIVAACRFLKQPHIYDTIAVAARASGVGRRACERWTKKISDHMEAPGDALSALDLVDDDAADGQATHPSQEVPSPPEPDMAAGLSLLADISIGSSGSAPQLGPTHEARDEGNEWIDGYWTPRIEPGREGSVASSPGGGGLQAGLRHWAGPGGRYSP